MLSVLSPELEVLCIAHRVVVQFAKIPHFVRDDKSRKRHSERSEESFLIPKTIRDSK